MAAEFILSWTKQIVRSSKILCVALPLYEDCMTEKLIFTFLWKMVKFHILIKDLLIFRQIGGALSPDLKRDSSDMN